MNRSMIDLWVGIFVTVGFAALIFLALKVGNLASFSTDQTYSVHAKFANIGGLKVRGPVKSAGVVVGRVADIRFDNESYEAIVSMNLDSGYQFPRDTTAGDTSSVSVRPAMMVPIRRTSSPGATRYTAAWLSDSFRKLVAQVRREG